VSDRQPSLWDTPTETRRLARAKAAADASEHRHRLLAAFRRCGPMTADGAGAVVGLGPLSARPRVCELRKAGLLEDTGESQPSALGNPSAVYRARP
jgi:predicted ArsR family transcriptional regulator